MHRGQWMLMQLSGNTGATEAMSPPLGNHQSENSTEISLCSANNNYYNPVLHMPGFFNIH